MCSRLIFAHFFRYHTSKCTEARKWRSTDKTPCVWEEKTKKRVETRQERFFQQSINYMSVFLLKRLYFFLCILDDLTLHHSALETAPESVEPLPASQVKAPEHFESMKPQDGEILSSWDTVDEVIDDWENIHGEEQEEVASCVVEQVVQTTTAENEVCNSLNCSIIHFFWGNWRYSSRLSCFCR